MTTLEAETAWALAMGTVTGAVESKAGTGVDTLPSGTVALADCAGCKHRGEGYWTAQIRLQVNSPALEEDPLPLHAATWKAVSTWLEDSAAVHAAFEATELVLHGFFVQDSEAGREDNRHIGETILVCGLQRKPEEP